MRIPSELRQLGRLFPQETPLYLVGGAVRDNLLGIQSSDYDVAAALETSDIKALLKDTTFRVRGEYARTGTIVIVGNRIVCEYTTFRTDSYPLGRGDHSPQSVAFTKDIYQDALRRDFSCNAVYYNIAQDSFIDPTDGISAIKNRLIDTTRAPQKVLQEDALRILRIARLSCELGFHVAPEVIAAAGEYVIGLSHIARERIGAEVLKILNCQRKYPDFHDCFNPSYGLTLLEEIGANVLIFGKTIPFTTFCALDKLKNDGYYAYTTAIQLALILLNFTQEQLVQSFYNLALSNATIAEINSIISGYRAIEQSDLNTLPYDVAKLSVAKVYTHIRAITAIRMANGLDVERLCDITHIICSLQLPTTVSDLKINGNAVIAKGYEGAEIGKVIDFVLVESIIRELTTQEEQLNLIDLYGEKL